MAIGICPQTAVIAPLIIIRITDTTMASDTGMDTDVAMAIPGDFRIIIIPIDTGN